MDRLETAESPVTRWAEFKDRVARVLGESGCEEVPPEEFDRVMGEGRAIYSRRYPLGKTIYGTPWRGDFIVHHPECHPMCLVIETRWQTVSGTTDQKLPFLVLTINAGRHPALIVLGGNGFSVGAVKWLRRQVGRGRLLAVWDAGEFETRWREGGV